MNVREIVTQLEVIVRQVEDIDSALAELDRKRADLVSTRGTLSAKLDAVQAAVGGAQPPKHAPPAKRAPSVAADSRSALVRLNEWIARRTSPFTIAEARKAIPDASGRYASWLLWSAETKKEIVRVERGKYMRAPEGPEVQERTVTAPMPATFNEDAPREPEAGTKIADVLAWCRAQPGTFTFSQCRDGTGIEGNRVAVILGQLRQRGFLKSAGRGQYDCARASVRDHVIAEAAE